MDSDAQGPELTDTAAAWLASLDAGTADVAAFEAWRDADVRHAIAFAEVAATWRALGDLRPLRADAAPPAPDLRAHRRHGRRTVLRAAVGTGVAAAIGGGWAYSAYARDRAATGIGERRTIRIDDRLTIELNTDTVLHWRMRDARPTLWLDRGEAAIDCRTDAMPVELRTPAGDFALGDGSFNARLDPPGCVLTVFDGQARGAGRTARADERLSLRGGKAVATPGDPLAFERTRGWRQGMLVLEGDRLGDALAEYNRYLRHKLVIGDPAIASLRLGGRFSTGDVRGFLRAMHASFGIAARQERDGTITLTAT